MDGRHHFVDLDGLRFHYVEWGDDAAPPLLLLHGVLTAAVAYETFACRLAANHHVYALDQRGHGESARSDDYSWPRWVDDLEAFFSAVDLDSADVVGHSRGANNAMRFAARRPERVNSLVLVEGGIGPTDAPDEPQYWAQVDRLAPDDGFASPEGYVDCVAKLFPRADLEIARRTASSFRERPNGNWEFAHRADLNVLAMDAPTAQAEREMRRSIPRPVLVVKGEHSELFTDAALATADEFPDATVCVLPDAGHMVMLMENIDGLVAVVEDFLLRRRDG